MSDQPSESPSWVSRISSGLFRVAKRAGALVLQIGKKVVAAAWLAGAGAVKKVATSLRDRKQRRRGQGTSPDG